MHPPTSVTFYSFIHASLHTTSSWGNPVRFSPVQLKNGIYALGKAYDYVFHSVSQKYPQRCLWNSSSGHLAWQDDRTAHVTLGRKRVAERRREDLASKMRGLQRYREDIYDWQVQLSGAARELDDHLDRLDAFWKDMANRSCSHLCL